MTPTPMLTERSGQLGWIASTPPDYPYRFAAFGRTQGDATTAFAKVVERWEHLGDGT